MGVRHHCKLQTRCGRARQPLRAGAGVKKPARGGFFYHSKEGD